MIDPYFGKRFGHCQIRKKLGSGGMGSVYLAHHAGLNKPVAIKILSHELAAQPEFIGRFVREARLAARLEHPNVVQVFDVGQEGEVHYIAMQYVEGKSLEDLLGERGRLSVNEAVSVAKRVAVALAEAHKLGIVHRDVKPANILISKDGVVKVADFGLAKDSDANRSLSTPGQIIGTPYYLSPEQAQGEKVDHRSDLYSLGATLYHMVTGRRVFQGNSPLSVVLKHASEEPISPREIDPSIPEALCAVIAKMMDKRPERRYASAEELVRDLDALKAGVSVSAKYPRVSLRRAAAIALPVVGLVVLGIVLWILAASGGADPSPGSAKALAGDPIPTAPKAEPRPEPPERPKPGIPPLHPHPGILERIQDDQERRMAEGLLKRLDEFFEAFRKKDYATLRNCVDRLIFDDLTDAQVLEKIASTLIEKKLSQWELERWEIQDVRLRPRKNLKDPPSAEVTFVLVLKHPDRGAVLTLPPHEQPWVYRRLDGRWYLMRHPKNSGK